MKEKIGIIGTADIAYRRFLPALKEEKEIEYVGVAARNPDKGKKFAACFGGNIYDGYEKIIQDEMITSMYIPLPPALHTYWGMRCLEKGIHVFMEKPFTVSQDDTVSMIRKAKETQRVVFENYAFLYHRQLQMIREMVFAQRLLGDLRLVRINFSFPNRGEEDFRYNKESGGGALLDCGGYTVRLAEELLSEKISVETAKLNYVPECGVDLFGTVTLQDENGLVAQLAFGMDNGYKCELEIIGQNGWLRAPRIFTAPADYQTEIIVNVKNEEKKLWAGTDNQFLNAIRKFKELRNDDAQREKMYHEIWHTAKLVECIGRMGTGMG